MGLVGLFIVNDHLNIKPFETVMSLIRLSMMGKKDKVEWLDEPAESEPPK